MEPANLNPPPDRDDDARLEAMLREPIPLLADDGFSARVLRALPPPPPAPALWPRVSLCAVSAALGILVAFVGAAPWVNLNENWASVHAAFAPVGARLSEPAVLAALVVALASVVYALRPSFRRTSA